MNVIYDANEHIVKTVCTDFVTKDTVLGNIAARLFQYGIQVTAETVVSVIQLQLSKEHSKEAADLYRFLDNFSSNTWGNIDAIMAMIRYTDIFGTTAGHDRLIELDLGIDGELESSRINVIVACCNLAMITYDNPDYDFWRRHVITNYILTYFKNTTKEYRTLFTQLIDAIVPKKYVNAAIDVDRYLRRLIQPLTRECLIIESGVPHFLHDLFEEFPREGATAGMLYMGFLNRNVRSSMFETLINMYGSRNTFDFHGPLTKHVAEVESISQYIMSFFTKERFVMKLSNDNICSTSRPVAKRTNYEAPMANQSTTLYPTYFVHALENKYTLEVTDALKQFKQCGTDFIKIIKWREDHIELLKKIYPEMDPDVDVDTMVFLLNDRYPDVIVEEYDTTDLPVNLEEFGEYGKPVTLDEYDEVFTDSVSEESDTIDLGDFTYYDSPEEDEDVKYLM